MLRVGNFRSGVRFEFFFLVSEFHFQSHVIAKKQTENEPRAIGNFLCKNQDLVHQERCSTILSQMNSAARPSPNKEGNSSCAFINFWAAFRIRFSSASASMAAPHSTSSTHSVCGRRMTHGLRKKNASF